MTSYKEMLDLNFIIPKAAPGLDLFNNRQFDEQKFMLSSSQGILKGEVSLYH